MKEAQCDARAARHPVLEGLTSRGLLPFGWVHDRVLHDLPSVSGYAMRHPRNGRVTRPSPRTSSNTGSSNTWPSNTGTGADLTTRFDATGYSEAQSTHTPRPRAKKGQTGGKNLSTTGALSTS